MNIRLIEDKDIKLISEIHVDNWKSIYQKVFPSEYLANLNYNDAEKEWVKYLERDDTFIYVAESEQDIVCGFIAGKLDEENPCSGMLYSLHVSQHNRGKGIGKQLIITAAHHFQSMQINSMFLWAVDANEHAISIYKHLGAKVYKDEIRYFEWVPVHQLGLIWKDISCLCKMN